MQYGMRTVGQKSWTKNLSNRELDLNNNAKSSFIMWILYTFF